MEKVPSDPLSRLFSGSFRRLNLARPPLQSVPSLLAASLESYASTLGNFPLLRTAKPKP
jgi:hypothetical protein